MSKGDSTDFPRLQATPPTKKKCKGGFDEHPDPGEAGLSRKGWQPHPTLQAGHKCAAALTSQSLKKTPVKIAWQQQVQYQLSQQHLQPAPVRVYLPSAPMGALRAFKTNKKSLASGTAEWAHLEQEVRASAELYTRQGMMAGTVQAVLQQLAQPSRRTDEPMVPRIQADELCVCHAGAHLRDQARVQNLQHFMEWEEEKKQQQPATALVAAVDQLTSSMARQQLQPVVVLPPAAVLTPAAVLQQRVPPPPPTDPTEDIHMDTGVKEMDPDQGDVAMDVSSGAHDKDAMGETETKET